MGISEGGGGSHANFRILMYTSELCVCYRSDNIRRRLRNWCTRLVKEITCTNPLFVRRNAWRRIESLQQIAVNRRETADGGTVVKVLCYKSEDRWFVSTCHARGTTSVTTWRYYDLRPPSWLDTWTPPCYGLHALSTVTVLATDIVPDLPDDPW
jgi:hypothetical protein